MSRVSREMAPAMASCPGMVPGLILKQRHWRTRGGPSFQDAYLEVDLRTLNGDSESVVKKQREWIETAQHVVANKASNLETAGRCETSPMIAVRRFRPRTLSPTWRRPGSVAVPSSSGS